MSQTDAAGSFLDKWLQRWPEWSVAEVFVPAPQRRLAVAWFSLLQELTEAAWGGADPAPGLAKLAWWHEELEGWAKGARRHPLGAILQRTSASWERLGRTLNVLPATRAQAPEQAMETLAGLAAAVSARESALFPDDGRGQDVQRSDASAFVATALLAGRALLTADRDTAGWLLARWPQPMGAPLPRRLQTALLRARLQALVRGPADGGAARSLPGWRVLALSWRASRGR